MSPVPSPSQPSSPSSVLARTSALLSASLRALLPPTDPDNAAAWKRYERAATGVIIALGAALAIVVDHLAIALLGVNYFLALADGAIMGFVTGMAARRWLSHMRWRARVRAERRRRERIGKRARLARLEAEAGIAVPLDASSPCPHCAKPTVVGATRCVYCGKALASAPLTVRVCDECGARLPDDASYCPDCGRYDAPERTPRHAVSVAPVQPPQLPPQLPPSGLFTNTVTTADGLSPKCRRHKWVTVTRTAVHVYDECSVCHTRQVQRRPDATGWQPIDHVWLAGGEWSHAPATAKDAGIDMAMHLQRWRAQAEASGQASVPPAKPRP